MLTASDYRKRSRKVIVLPSGGEVEIRKLFARDYLSVGEIPAAFREAVQSGDKKKVAEAIDADRELAKRMLAATLIQGVVSMKIVEKHPRNCAEDETSIDEISPEDQNFIAMEIAAFNSMGGGSEKVVARFPEESSPARDAGCDSGAVREAADGDPGSEH
jgi:hypothetical protein